MDYMNVSIYPYTDGSGTWAVERCAPDDDGIVEKATFSGPDAERQARGFAWAEFGVRAPAPAPAVDEDAYRRFCEMALDPKRWRLDPREWMGEWMGRKPG